MKYGLLRLRCGVQHYDWGDTDFIPALLGIDNPEREPYAELWMGAHPDLPAEAEADGKWVPLNELIDASPDEVLGPAVTREFEGRLPYLFKVLSAKAPLSIQAHPSKDAAKEGFARENAAGVPLTARHRNYRDDNHKPELITALTDFYGLRGFRPLPEIARVLQQAPEFRELMPDFEPTPECVKTLYEKFMSLPQAEVDSVFDPLVRRLKEADAKRPFTRDELEYWVLKADRDYPTDGHRDRGLLSFSTPTSRDRAWRSWPTPTTSCGAGSHPSTRTCPNYSPPSRSKAHPPRSCARPYSAESTSAPPGDVSRTRPSLSSRG
jgi:mannose-6-phosphate isomerase class I